jgi:transcriptional regulator with XRE-family HTH domain
MMKVKKHTPKLNRIADVLRVKRMTQRTLAKKLGISTNAVNAICQQKAQPLERFFEIAEILDVPITELINVDYKPKRKAKPAV